MISHEGNWPKVAPHSPSQGIKLSVHDFLSSSKNFSPRKLYVALDILHLMHSAIAHSHRKENLYTITNSNLCLDFIGKNSFPSSRSLVIASLMKHSGGLCHKKIRVRPSRRDAKSCKLNCQKNIIRIDYSLSKFHVYASNVWKDV